MQEVLVRRIDVGAATDSEVLDVMMPTHASSSAPPNKVRGFSSAVLISTVPWWLQFPVLLHQT